MVTNRGGGEQGKKNKKNIKLPESRSSSSRRKEDTTMPSAPTCLTTGVDGGKGWSRANVRCVCTEVE